MIIRRFYILLTLTLSVVTMPALAQKKAESEKSRVYKDLKIKSSKEGTSGLLAEAESLKSRSPRQALELVKEALAMSIATQDLESESKCYLLLAEINLDISENRLALENFNAAKERLDQVRRADSDLILRSTKGMGVAHLRLGNLREALDAFQRVKGMRLTSTERVTNAVNISEVFYQMTQYEEALKALDIDGPKGLGEASALKIENQKVKIYARMNQLERASSLLYSNQSRSRASGPSAKAAAEDEAMQVAKEELSDVLAEQGRYDDQITLRENSIDYNLERKNLAEVSRDKVELSKALVAKGETGEAIRELQEAAFIADTIGDPKKQSEAYLSLANLYDNFGRTDAAIETYRKYSHSVARNEEKMKEDLSQRSELIRTQRDIQELSGYVAVQKEQENLAMAMVFRQRLIIYGLLLIILIIGVTSYFIHKNAVASRTANQLLALKSLRSQMNPHFIFNALNSVNHFVARNDELSTNKFLSEFSRLMRLVLENSQEDFIPLFKEEEIISLYLKLEHYRFGDKFDYTINMDPMVNKEAVEIPPMLIQPYIENAIWHGLRYKDEKGFLSVDFRVREMNLVVSVVDNGIGRKRSAELKTANQKKHESTGLKNIRERMGIINRVYKTTYRVDITDMDNDGGTRVEVFVPLRENHNKDA